MRLSPADIRNAALLSVATVAAGFVVPVFPWVGLPLAAFALGWVTYRFGAVPATVLALGTAACVAVFGPSVLGTSVVDGAFVGVALLAVGPIAAQALRRYPALYVAAGTALVITLVYLVTPIGADTLKIWLDAWRQAFAAAASSGSVSDPATIKAAALALLAQLSATWPALSFYTMGIGTAIGVTLTGRAGRSLGVDVRRYGSLADMDLTFHMVWPAIVGLALTAAGSLWHQAPALVGTIGENVLMFVRPFLFLQGAAAFAALYRRMGAGRVTKTIGFVLLLLTESFVPSVSVLGLVDLFANLRKIPRAHSAPPLRAV